MGTLEEAHKDRRVVQPAGNSVGEGTMGEDVKPCLSAHGSIQSLFYFIRGAFAF